MKCILVRQGTGFQLLGTDAHVLKQDLKYSSWRQGPFAESGPKRGVMLAFLFWIIFVPEQTYERRQVLDYGLCISVIYRLTSSPPLLVHVHGKWCPEGALLARGKQAVWIEHLGSQLPAECAWGKAFLCSPVLQLLSTAGWSHNIKEEGS